MCLQEEETMNVFVRGKAINVFAGGRDYECICRRGL